MNITDIDHRREGSSTLLTARVHWENSQRPPFDIRFEISPASTVLEDQAGNALLTALLPLAFHDREQRLVVEAPACPMLVDNLDTVIAWWNKWAGSARHELAISSRPSTWRASGRRGATAFLSGGVDSFHLLQRNRDLYPAGSPAAIERAIIVHGFDIGRRKADPEIALFELIRDRVARFAARHGVEVSVCRTNLRHIKHTPGYWFERMFAPAAIATGHAMVEGEGYLMLGASFDIDGLAPIGSHPAVDVQLSSQRLGVLHEGSRFSRLQKIRELARWQDAIDNLRVCGEPGRSEYNCRRCEKCLRTRLQLLAVGCAHSDALGPSLIDPAMFDGIEISNGYQLDCYVDALDGLRSHGHDRLVCTIEAKITTYRNDPANRPGT